MSADGAATTPERLAKGVIPYIQVEGAADAITFYARAFGAREISRTASPDGKIMNAQLEINDGLLMVMDAMPEHDFPSRRATASQCN